MDYTIDFEDKYFGSSYGKMFYKHHSGTGAKLIFLHGFGASSKVWSHLVKTLPNQFNVYLIDLLGHGNSEKPDLEYSINVQVSMLSQFMEKEALQDAVLIGHSYGGWVAAKYAASNLKLRALVLEDSAGLQAEYDAIEKSGKVQIYKEKMLIESLALNNNSEKVMRNLLDHAKEGLLTQEDFAKISVPTLVIWGENDKVVPYDYSKDFVSGIKGAKFISISGAGHSSHFSKAEEVAKAISDFIS